MKNNLAALRYSKALINFSENKKASKKIYEEMKVISNFFSQNKKALNLFSNPVILISKKKKLIFKLLKNTSKETTRLIDLLEKNKRLYMIRDISLNYINLYKSKKGISNAKITTAVKLSKELEIKVMEKLKNIHKGEIKILNVIDPKIIGGFIINFKGLQYDASVKNQFKLLKSQIVT
ncbi:MAG: ATP synthase F1 subunit delta [Flavobacteriaceae bacterium]|nr:ATP synthase F1 subunit delta [Flavobacteriaceae bacterium]|tara:strand:+ start:7499 stop:8032 length:534 start_codon:yes stop_codon:yes gene_type:complete